MRHRPGTLRRHLPARRRGRAVASVARGGLHRRAGCGSLGSRTGNDARARRGGATHADAIPMSDDDAVLRRGGPIALLLRGLTLALVLCVLPAQAKLPREVGRAFLDAGIPLNHVGIVVQDTTKPRPLFAYDPERPRNPASVMKLVTTFAALELLG